MNEADLPEGWKTCTLEVIAKFIDYRGRTPKKTSNGIPLITAKNIRDGYINREPREYIAESDYDDWMTRGIPKVGDVVITTEAPMGNVALINISEKFALAQRAICLQCYEPELGNFLHYALRSPTFQKLLTLNATGTTVSGIKAATLKKLKIPFPSLAEQKVIAYKLNTQLAQVEATKARLKLIPNIIRTFRRAVLDAAVSGKLANSNSSYYSIEVKGNWAHEVVGLTHWREYKFSDVIKIIGGSQPPKSDFSNEEKDGYIRLIQIRDYKSESHKVYIPLEKAKRFVSKEDIMIGRYGPPIFQILRGLEGAYNVALMKAEPNTKILDREYLYWYLQNYKLFNYIDAGSDRTAGQTGVNKKYLESYPILVPPLDEQTEIVRRIEDMFAFVDNIEQKSNAALEQVNNLTQSILAKAFRGELTAYWRAANPNLIGGENSAETLLEKIKSEREIIKKQPKPKRSAVEKKTGNRMSKPIKVVDALKQAGEPLSGQQLLRAAGYPSDSCTDQLEQFFLDIRDALVTEESIVKLERDDDSQDWFALAKPPMSKVKS
ncbi:restriction endonuclease subunit S [Klebsiella grimontii]|uniref:restriction endonuclease subunit S n=1 Tax=Klebsiella grimontii TaxID=2058152 RepID=UPI001D0EEB21|nr:restriction endonuclease subunit S [Klebsiella grimontii]MBE8891069.1 restriction endonuclease subunit S [Klebsiella grimontii]